jgi:hypothetical protein
MSFPHIFQPISIGTLTSKNRLLMSAMSIHFGVDDQGHVTMYVEQGCFIHLARQNQVLGSRCQNPGDAFLSPFFRQPTRPNKTLAYP